MKAFVFLIHQYFFNFFRYFFNVSEFGAFKLIIVCKNALQKLACKSTCITSSYIGMNAKVLIIVT